MSNSARRTTTDVLGGSDLTRTLSDGLQHALDAARNLSQEEIPFFLGRLEVVRAVAWARLTSPVIPEHVPDELLDVEEAARRLHSSPAFLYRHHDRFPFTRRVGRNLRFSARGIERYIRGAISSRTPRSAAKTGGVP